MALLAGLTLDGEPVPAFMDNLLELEVEEDARVSSVFRIRVSILRGDQGLWNRLDDDAVKPWAKAVVTVTVGQEEEELITGYVTEIQTHIDVDEGNSWVELSGMDTTCLMNLEEKVKAWPNKSDSDIAREILKDYVPKATIEDTGIVHTDSTGDILQRETDIQFLRRLARRNGYECVVQREEAFFRKPDYSAERRPVLSVHFGGDTNVATFDARLTAARPVEASGTFMDVIAKEPLAAKSTAAEATLLGKDAGGTFTPPRQARTLLLKQPAFSGRPELEAMAQAAARESEFFIEAKGEIDGVTYGAALHARDIVPVKGVGEVFSGAYFVTSVRHVFNVDRYVQHFTARRNAARPAEGDFSGAGLLPF